MLRTLELGKERRAQLLEDVRERVHQQDRPAWHLFIVRLDCDRTGMTRDEFMQALKQRQIGTGLHFRAIHLQKYYRETLPEIAGTLPETEWNSDRICSLPLFPDMRLEDVDRVVDAIKTILKRTRT